MQDLKISLITVTRNAEKTISRCINSVLAQTYPHLEYIVIDGASTDNTLHIIESYKQQISFFISEPDQGIYDAINTGIKAATGDIIGILNADDYFVDDEVLNNIAEAFKTQNTDAVYADLNYINPNGAIIRKWRSGTYKQGLFNWGWMPPHPTFYAKKELFKNLGFYDLSYGSAADYELMLRFVHLKGVSLYYLDKVIVNMEIGGVSNRNILNRLRAWGGDYRAMKKNGISLPSLSVIFKPLRKVFQYV